MKKNILLIFLVTVGQVLFAQTQFQHRYGSQFSDYSDKIIQSFDGSYFVMGGTYGFGSYENGFLMKVDSNGNSLWVKDYSGINSEEILDGVELPNHNLVMCGATGSYGAGSTDAFIMETGSAGNLIWAKTYGNFWLDYFSKIVKDGTGGYYAAGIMQRIPNMGGDLGTVIIRIDNIGNVIWQKWMPVWSSSVSRPTNLIVLNNGSVILTGASDGNHPIICWKFSQTGSLFWSHAYTAGGNGGFNGDGLALCSGDSGSFYVGSVFNGTALSIDFAVLKLDANGTLMWINSYGGTYSENMKSLVKASDGVIISGQTNSTGNGGHDACLIKLNHSGTVQWANACGTVWYDSPTNLIQTSDNGYAFTGMTYSYGFNQDSIKVHLVKTDSSGNSMCNTVQWNPIVMTQTANVIAAILQDTISFLTNSFTFPVNNRTFCEVNICNPTSITELNSIEGLSVYPNPFTSQISIAVKKDNVKEKIFIVRNTLGQVVYKTQERKLNSIDLSFLSKGIYLLDINIDGERTVKKIVKE